MANQTQMKLWYTIPAPTVNDGDFARRNNSPLAGWEKWSLPLGNSYFGVSVFGRIETERLQITENSVSNPGIFGLHWKAGNYGTRTFGDIYIDTFHKNVENYERGLSVDSATAYVSYEIDGVTYRREYFTSYPDRVLAVRFFAEQEGIPASHKISMDIRLDIPFVRDYCAKEGDGCGRTGEVFAENDRLIMRGESLYYAILTEGQAKVKAQGGSVRVTDRAIEIRNADEAVLFFTCGTNYRMESRVFTESDPKQKLAPYPAPHEKVTEILDAAYAKGYTALYATHLSDYRGLYRAVTLDIGYDPKDLLLTTDRLLRNYQEGKRSAYLETLYYQYGRYLLIASSRKGGYPANLQGTWNCYDSSPWGCDYHHNINVQMNYWPSGIANLSECFLPYIDYARAYLDSAHMLADDYIKTNYPEHLSPTGENGWFMGTAAFLYYIGKADWHSGPGTGGFTSLLFWDYYAFTGDKEYLRKIGYPFLREMSLFLSKVLIESDGKLLVKKSASPEQIHNGVYYQTVGCAFDQQMIYENHKCVLLAAQALGIKDDPVLDIVRRQIDKLDPVQIGLDGQIKEFREEEHYGEIGEYEHRHISHLVGLYPGTLINKDSPEWLNGAEISLTRRSDKSTGWAAAHRLCAWARTGIGNRAFDLYQSILKNNTLPNLWDTHPPFQIDGNFGAVAGVSEMLLQSQAGFIDFLAAKPDVWENGSFDGLVARGNFVCGCDWANHKITQMRITARIGGKCRIRYENIANAKIEGSYTVISENEIELNMYEGELQIILL
ncbi:MAG: glycoside hydrolase N-terminal domain-containing protein [Clostridia bacterium]|nr:glycoside hydrolase N-terminal domain-containing protein [Clostridia bacterium]